MLGGTFVVSSSQYTLIPLPPYVAATQYMPGHGAIQYDLLSIKKHRLALLRITIGLQFMSYHNQLERLVVVLGICTT
jgi:hypothetical protein